VHHDIIKIFTPTDTQEFLH